MAGEDDGGGDRLVSIGVGRSGAFPARVETRDLVLEGCVIGVGSGHDQLLGLAEKVVVVLQSDATSVEHPDPVLHVCGRRREQVIHPLCQDDLDAEGML